MSSGLRDHCTNAVLCCLLAFTCSQLSYQLRVDTTDVMIASAYGTLSGEPFLPEFQSRVMFPLMLRAARSMAPATMSDQQLWKGTRLVTAMIAFGVLFSTLKAVSGSSIRARVGVLLAANAYVWGPLYHEYEQPFDFLDVTFMSLFAWLALRERDLALLLTTVAASFNRESAAFSGVIVAGLALARHGLTWCFMVRAAFAAVLMVVVLGMTVWLRTTLAADYGGEQHVGLAEAIANWRWVLQVYGPGTALVAMVLPVGAALWWMPRPFSQDQRGVLWASLGCAAISAVFGVVFELRVLLPSYVLLVFTLVLAGASERDRQWLWRIVGGGRESA